MRLIILYNQKVHHGKVGFRNITETQFQVRNIISGLHQLILDKDSRIDKERVLAQYFVQSLNTHNFWALKMLFIEFLNLLNVIGNIYLVDAFLGGEFSTYGLDVSL